MESSTKPCIESAAVPSTEALLDEAADAKLWTGSWLPLVAAWLVGALALAGLVTFVLRFGDFAVFIAAVRRADPVWVSAAVACQAATYACAAGVWFHALRRHGSPLPFASLLRLALVELFANQAVPTAGISGSLMVVRGLMRRGVAAPVAMTALFVAGLSYYAAFLMVGLLAFVLLWHSGDLNAAWRSLLLAFAIVVVALAGGIVLLTWSKSDLIPAWMLKSGPLVKLAKALDQVRLRSLWDVRLVMIAATLQIAVFVLDAATLWCTCRAVGLAIDAGGVFTSFVLATIVATLSPLPLGLGSFEGTSTGLLHLMGGGLEASLAATLMLRGLTLWLPMLPGLWLIRREASTRRPRPISPAPVPDENQPAA